MRSLLAAVVLFSSVFSVQAQVAHEKEKTEGFVPFFNGRDLDGWKIFEARKPCWIVDKGHLVCQGDGGGWLGTTRDYADYVLRLEYRLTPGSNSGIYLRAPEKGHISRVGMEIQILDDNHPKYARLDFYQYTGSLYHVMPPRCRASKPAGEWNSMEIRAIKRRLFVGLNGKTLVDTDLDECLRDPEIAKEHTGLARSTGRIGLQSHNDVVEFRNLRIKELKMPGD